MLIWKALKKILASKKLINLTKVNHLIFLIGSSFIKHQKEDFWANWGLFFKKTFPQCAQFAISESNSISVWWSWDTIVIFLEKVDHDRK